MKKTHIVLYIPQAAVCPIFISCMSNDSQITSHFDNQICWLTDKMSNTIIAQGTLTSWNLYALNLFESQTDNALITTAQPNIEMWHRQLGHANYQAISDMSQKDMVTGISFNPSIVPSKCQSCVTGKQTRTPVPKAWEEGRRATRRLEIVWVDLSGPHNVISQSGNKYVMNLVDDATSFPWLIPIPSKDVAYSEVKTWELAWENETSTKVGTYRTDNRELKSKVLDEWLCPWGIRQEFTAPYMSAHNGRVEWMHRTLMNKSRMMRIYLDLPPNLWDELYLTASYLHARTTTWSLQGLTPFTQWYKKKPDLSHLHEIRCKVFVLIQDKNNPKIYQRSVECVLLGYEPNAKAYRCYHRPSKQIITSYHVSFIESHQTNTTPAQPPKIPTTPLVTVDSLSTNANQDTTVTSMAPSWPEYDEDNDRPIMQDNVMDNSTDIATVHTPDSSQLHWSAHVRKPAEKASMDGQKYQSHLAAAVAEAHLSAKRIREACTAHLQCIQELHDGVPLVSQASTGSEAIQLLKEIVNNPEDPMSSETARRLDDMLITVSNEMPNFVFKEEPCTWEEAKHSHDAVWWENGYWEELRSLKEMGMYELVPQESIPAGTKVWKGQPLFVLKCDEFEEPTQWKVHLVFKRFEQIYGWDYTKTTSPTAQMESWQILLHIAAILGWDVQQVDIKTAFLYRLLPDDEVQYMEQPEGFLEPGRETWVWKLLWGLYGMKQAGQIWNRMMNEAMISWGFIHLSTESCVYYWSWLSGIIITMVHVDDFLAITLIRLEIA